MHFLTSVAESIRDYTEAAFGGCFPCQEASLRYGEATASKKKITRIDRSIIDVEQCFQQQLEKSTQ